MISRLRQRRDELKMSQEDLGAAVGVDGMTVSRWERGESLPQRRHWPKLLEVTSLSIVDLLEGSDAENAP